MRHSISIFTARCAALGMLAAVFPGQADERVIPSQEWVALPASAILKQITIRLQGTEEEMVFLQQAQAVVQDLLARASLNVEKIYVPESMAQMSIPGAHMPVERRLLLKLEPGAVGPPVRLSVTLEDPAKPGPTRAPWVFVYDPGKPQPFREALRDYLSQTFNLTIPPSSAPTPRLSPPPSLHAQGFPAEPVEPVVPSQEYIYQGGGHTVYSEVRIILDGTDRERAVLQDLEQMVKELLDRAYPRTRGEAKPRRTLRITAAWDDTRLFVHVHVSLDGSPAQSGDFLYDPNSPAMLEERLRRYLQQTLDAVIPP